MLNTEDIIFHTIAGEPQRAQSPGQTPALLIPRWDRHDNDVGIQRRGFTTKRKPDRNATLTPISLTSWFALTHSTVFIWLQMNSCRLVSAATWQTERQQRHLTPRSTSTNKSTDRPKWDDNAPTLTKLTQAVTSFTCTRKMVGKRKEKKHLYQEYWSEQQNKLLHEKGREKVTRIAFNERNKPAEARARSSAWW